MFPLSYRIDISLITEDPQLNGRGLAEIGSSDPRSQFLRACFSVQTRMGLASGAGSVALPTSFGGKGPHLKQ